MTRPYVVYHWRDNNNKRAEVRVRFTGPQTFDAIAAQAAAMASVLEPASDARLVSYDIVFTVPYDAAAPASLESDARSYTLLFYKDDDRVSSLRVPSAGHLPYQDTGPYAGIRVTRADLDLSGLLDTVEAMAAGVVDRLGRPYPTTFSVGGRVTL